MSCALGGPNTDEQFHVFDKMLQFLKDFRVLHSRTGTIRTAKLPWEHGLICNINSTKALYQELVVNGPFEFLMTSKLNQDCIENLFSRIRGESKVYSRMIQEECGRLMISHQGACQYQITGSLSLDAKM